MISRGASSDEYQYDDFVVPDDYKEAKSDTKRLKKRARTLFIDLVSSEEENDEIILIE